MGDVTRNQLMDWQSRENVKAGMITRIDFAGQDKAGIMLPSITVDARSGDQYTKHVRQSFIDHYKPLPGDYLIEHLDGSTETLSAETFEDRYSLLG
ncbi:MAG: hypothetical protein ACR2QH_15265 [Geminicoccaceae bacterium]